MPSPIATDGFSLRVMPDIRFTDPRLLTPAYASILPAINQGIETADTLAMGPLRKQLAQIQLQEAQNRLAAAPIEQQLQALRLAEAQQKSAIPEQIVDVSTIRGGDRQLVPVDPNASFENFSLTEAYTPRERVLSGREFLAGGGVRPFTKTETLDTAGDVAAKRQKEQIATMAEQRRIKEQEDYAQFRRQKLSADIAKATSPEYARGQSGVDSDGKLVTVYFNRKTGDQVTIPTDLAPIKAESEAVQIINALTGGGGKPVSAEVQIDISKPISAAEAAKLPSGTEFIGLDGVRRKRK